jgi:uncharacterized protein
MLKLLIWIALAYLAYRTVTKWLGGGRQSRMQGPDHPQVDDVMIKDPECGSYFPRRNGVIAEINGNPLHFCSDACRDRYLARL